MKLKADQIIERVMCTLPMGILDEALQKQRLNDSKDYQQCLDSITTYFFEYSRIHSLVHADWLGIWKKIPALLRHDLALALDRNAIDDQPRIWRMLPMPDGYQLNHPIQDQDWQEHLLSFTINQFDSDILSVELESIHLKKCWLDSIIFKHLFSKGIIKANGQFCRKEELSNELQLNSDHLTFRLSNPRFPYKDIFVKVFPEYPGKELALNIITRLLIDERNRNIELVKWSCGKYTYPVLFSEAIEGVSLTELYNENPQSYQHDAKRFSQQFIIASLAYFEHDNPDNRLANLDSINNERYGFPTFVNNELMVKSILYCFDQMQEALHPEVSAYFCLLSPVAVLTRWLLEVEKLGAFYSKLFFDNLMKWQKGKRSIFYKRQEYEQTCVLPLLSRTLIRKWFDRLVDGHMVCQEFGATHWQYLIKIDSSLAEYYFTAHKNKELLTPLDRFSCLAPCWKTELDWASQYKLLKDNVDVKREDPRKQWSIDLQNAKEALEQLSQTLPQLEQVENDLYKNSTTLWKQLDEYDAMEVLARINCKLISARCQKSIIARLERFRNLNKLILRHLNEIKPLNLSRIVGNNPNLEMIILIALPSISGEIFKLWGTDRCPLMRLKILKIIACERVKLFRCVPVDIWGDDLNPTSFHFPHLVKLIIRNCPIEELHMYIPNVRSLDLLGCNNLQYIDLNTGPLDEFYHSIATSITLKGEWIRHLINCVSISKNEERFSERVIRAKMAVEMLKWGMLLNYYALKDYGYQEGDWHGAALMEVDLSNEFLGKLDLTGANLSNTQFGLVSDFCDVGMQGTVCVTYHSNGHQFASQSDGTFIRLWAYQQSTWKNILSRELREDSIRCTAYHPESGRVVCGSASGDIFIWTPEGRLWNSPEIKSKHSGYVSSITFRTDGLQIASAGGKDLCICLWSYNEKTWRSKCIFSGHTDSISEITYRSDGKQLASGSLDKSVLLWSFYDNKVACTYKLIGHKEGVRCIAYRPDNLQLAAGCNDNSIYVWSQQGEGWKCAQILAGHNTMYNCLAFRSDGKQLASGGDRCIDLWSMHTEQWICTHVLNIETESFIHSVAYRPDTRQLAVAAKMKILLLSWDKLLEPIDNQPPLIINVMHDFFLGRFYQLNIDKCIGLTPAVYDLLKTNGASGKTIPFMGPIRNRACRFFPAQSASLPYDIMYKIFSHLNNESLLQLTYVCKLWYAAVRQMQSDQLIAKRDKIVALLEGAYSKRREANP